MLVAAGIVGPPLEAWCIGGMVRECIGGALSGCVVLIAAVVFAAVLAVVSFVYAGGAA